MTPKILQLVKHLERRPAFRRTARAVAVVHREDEGTLQITGDASAQGATGITGPGCGRDLNVPGQGNWNVPRWPFPRAAPAIPGMQALPVGGAVASVTVQ